MKGTASQCHGFTLFNHQSRSNKFVSVAVVGHTNGPHLISLRRTRTTTLVRSKPFSPKPCFAFTPPHVNQQHSLVTDSHHEDDDDDAEITP